MIATIKQLVKHLFAGQNAQQLPIAIAMAVGLDKVDSCRWALCPADVEDG